MNKTPLLVTASLLLGLGIGATVWPGATRAPVAAFQTTESPAPGLPATAPLEDFRAPPGFQPAQLAPGALLQNEQNTIAVVRQHSPGVVNISTESQSGMPGWMGTGQPSQGQGSGFFVAEDGLILTNYHVIQGARTNLADRITFRVLDDETDYRADVVAVAPQYDLALLRAVNLPRDRVHVIPLGDAERVQPGQKVLALGAPFGFEFSVTEGIVSSTARVVPFGLTFGSIQQRAIQTDAAINPGNSGGPLLNSAGQVIGINTMIISPAGAATGIGQFAGVGFAIPSNVAANLLPRLRAGGVVYAPRIGITAGAFVATRQGQLAVGLSLLPPPVREQFGLPESGLVVAEITPNSAAAAAGLRGGTRVQQAPNLGLSLVLGGDVIRAADGQRVDGIEDLQAVLVGKRQGDTVRLTVWREGQEREVTVRLGAEAFVSEPLTALRR